MLPRRPFLAALALTAMAAGCDGGPRSRQAVMESDAPSAEAPAGEEQAVEAPFRRSVRLYFRSAETGEWAYEERGIVRTPTLAGQASQALAELFAGPRRGHLEPCAPSRLRLNHLLVNAGGEAFVDLSLRGIPEGQFGGSAQELDTLLAIGYTLGANFPEIRALRFLVEGREAETLAGHVSIAFPWRAAAPQEAPAPLASGAETAPEPPEGASPA